MPRPSPAAPVFRCQGNEPFWNLLIEGETARLVSLAEPGVERHFVGDHEWKPETEPPELLWRGAEEGELGSRIEATLVEERCLDTMSDETPPFSHRVRVVLPDGTGAGGCCRTGSSPAGPSPSRPGE
jgi:uncharacterized membrane protein